MPASRGARRGCSPSCRRCPFRSQRHVLTQRYVLRPCEKLACRSLSAQTRTRQPSQSAIQPQYLMHGIPNPPRIEWPRKRDELGIFDMRPGPPGIHRSWTLSLLLNVRPLPMMVGLPAKDA
ncbi:unnamed protein product, partial [Mycena citricolor]